MRIDVLPASESDVADPTWLLGKQNSTKNSAGEDMSGADTAGEEEDGSAEDDVYDPWDDIPEDDAEETDSPDPWDAVDEQEAGITEKEDDSADGGVVFGKYQCNIWIR